MITVSSAEHASSFFSLLLFFTVDKEVHELSYVAVSFFAFVEIFKKLLSVKAADINDTNLVSIISQLDGTISVERTRFVPLLDIFLYLINNLFLCFLRYDWVFILIRLERFQLELFIKKVSDNIS